MWKEEEEGRRRQSTRLFLWTLMLLCCCDLKISHQKRIITPIALMRRTLHFTARFNFSPFSVVF